MPEQVRGRLPRFHRAGPSTSLDKRGIAAIQLVIAAKHNMTKQICQSICEIFVIEIHP